MLLVDLRASSKRCPPYRASEDEGDQGICQFDPAQEPTSRTPCSAWYYCKAIAQSGIFGRF
jgi:hypothetical protein